MQLLVSRNIGDGCYLGCACVCLFVCLFVCLLLFLLYLGIGLLIIVGAAVSGSQLSCRSLRGGARGSWSFVACCCCLR